MTTLNWSSIRAEVAKRHEAADEIVAHAKAEMLELIRKHPDGVMLAAGVLDKYEAKHPELSTVLAHTYEQLLAGLLGS